MKILYLPNQYSQQRQRDKKAWIYPVLLAMQAQYYRERGNYVMWGDKVNIPVARFYDGVDYDKVIREPEELPFLELPIPDRIFTNAFDKKYQKYGNYKYSPATHMMAALDCWYAKCNFCQWAKKYPEVQIRPYFEVVREIEQCAKLGFREVFDDSGTFPIGGWLDHFLCSLINAKVPIVLGCNMRITLSVDFHDMKRAGFRMILFGVESFNQYTLDKLNKGIKVEDIIPCIYKANEAGLESHAAIMTGYPWESYGEEMNTIEMTKWLLKKGLAKTAQASVYNVPESTTHDKGLKNKIYDVAYSPRFWINKLRDIKRWEDFVYLLKGIRKGIVRD